MSMHSRAHAKTPHARRYMIQLAKHWSHRWEVEFDDVQARIALPGGVARMTAGPETLDVDLETDDPTGVERFEQVFTEHLMRFAFREPDLKLDWARE